MRALPRCRCLLGWSVVLAVLVSAVSTLEAQEKPPTRPTTIGMTFQETAKGPVPVATVEPDSLAAKMGLRPGDMIISVNGEPVAGSATLDKMLTQVEPGKKFAVTVRRDGKSEDKSILVPEATVNMFGAALDGDAGGRIIVKEVAPNTPAERAGLATGDVVLTMAGQRHSSLSSLSEFMAKLVAADRADKAAEPIKVTVQRRGEEEPVALVIERDPAPMPAANTKPLPVRDLAAPAAKQLAFGIEVAERGTQVVITRLLEKGPAAVAGMMPGDIIVAVGKRPVQSHADLVAIAANLKPGDEVPVEIARGEKTGAVAIKVVKGKPDSEDVVLAASTNPPVVADRAAPMSVEQEVRDLRARVDALEQIVARLVRELGAQRR